MAFSAQTTPSKSITLSAFKDSTSGFYYIPFGPINIWFGEGIPEHYALVIGDLAINVSTGHWYAATSVSGAWSDMSD